MQWCIDNNFNVLNKGQPSHIKANGTLTAMDVTLVSDELHSMLYQWETNDDLNSHKKDK